MKHHFDHDHVFSVLVVMLVKFNVNNNHMPAKSSDNNDGTDARSP